MEVRLIGVSRAGRRKMFSLDNEVTTLGREPGCTLRVPLGEISRQHCELILSSDKVVIKDLDSANGTFVNDQKISEEELRPGDVISLANAVTLLIQIDGEPDQIDDSKLLLKASVKAGKAKVKEKQPSPAESAASFADTSSGATDADEADDILGESFFLDLEDNQDEDDDI